jgi:hypothetical protein
MNMSDFTAEEKHQEALRELKMRRDVYPRININPVIAKRRMAIMQEIADDYARQAQQERLL